MKLYKFAPLKKLELDIYIKYIYLVLVFSEGKICQSSNIEHN